MSFKRLMALAELGYKVELSTSEGHWMLGLEKAGAHIEFKNADIEICVASAKTWAAHEQVRIGAVPVPENPSFKCPSGKFVFNNQDLAEQAATNMTRKNLRRTREKDRTAARAYPCEDCGGWHVTSMSTEQFAQIKRTRSAITQKTEKAS